MPTIELQTQEEIEKKFEEMGLDTKERKTTKSWESPYENIPDPSEEYRETTFDNNTKKK